MLTSYSHQFRLSKPLLRHISGILRYSFWINTACSSDVVLTSAAFSTFEAKYNFLWNPILCLLRDDSSFKADTLFLMSNRFLVYYRGLKYRMPFHEINYFKICRSAFILWIANFVQWFQKFWSGEKKTWLST